MTVDDLQIINYCHPDCKPLHNIMRLPKDEAFALAYEMAARNKNATAFSLTKGNLSLIIANK